MSLKIWEDTELWWSNALLLPTLLWARPILNRMGLPDAIVKQPEVWASIYPKIDIEYETGQKLIREKVKNGEPVTIEGARALWRDVVTNALRKLADAQGYNTAIELEHWVIRHFFSEEFHRSMYAWYFVLDRSCLPADYDEKQIAPPTVMIPIIPEIYDLVIYEKRQDFLETLKQISPPFKDGIVDICSEALTISNIAEDTSIMKALQIIASKLSKAEREEVILWAKLQAEKLKSAIKVEDLKEGKYLQIEAPYSDIPSVLDNNLHK
jgi:hypothetical protein